MIQIHNPPRLPTKLGSLHGHSEEIDILSNDNFTRAPTTCKSRKTKLTAERPVTTVAKWLSTLTLRPARAGQANRQASVRMLCRPILTRVTMLPLVLPILRILAPTSMTSMSMRCLVAHPAPNPIPLRYRIREGRQSGNRSRRRPLRGILVTLPTLGQRSVLQAST